MNSCHQKLRILLLGIFALVTHVSYPYNIRHTSNDDGLSNSAILSLDLDPEGFLWIGTCDGVNIYDGSKVRTFSEMFPNLGLEGNIIESITHLNDGSTWVQTNKGLNRIERKGNDIRLFPQFQGQERITFDEDGNLFLFGEDGAIYFYSHGITSDFVSVEQTKKTLQDVRTFAIISDKLWIVTSEGIYQTSVTKKGDRVVSIGKLKKNQCVKIEIRHR